MIVLPQIVQSAKRQGNDNFNNQYSNPPTDKTRAYRIVDLLVDSTSPAAQPGARELLTQMALSPWKVIANVHRSESDWTPPYNC